MENSGLEIVPGLTRPLKHPEHLLSKTYTNLHYHQRHSFGDMLQNFDAN